MESVLRRLCSWLEGRWRGLGCVLVFVQLAGPGSLWNQPFFYARDSGVVVNAIVGGYFDALGGASGCVDRQGSVHSCYAYRPMGGTDGLYLDQTQIDNVWVARIAVAFDSLGRPQVAYVSGDGDLMYRYLGSGVWHILDLQTQGLTALDLIIDENSQPIIAYTTSAGLFLAHGVDIVGQSEDPGEPTANGLRLTASVVRNVLFLPVSPFTIHASLFDMTGRRVMALRPGANDVHHLPEGVYFIRGLDSAPARKVIVTR